MSTRSETKNRPNASKSANAGTLPSSQNPGLPKIKLRKKSTNKAKKLFPCHPHPSESAFATMRMSVMVG